ncbi:Ulp1 peptidase [Ranunculus cassubicifolius]
MDDKDRQCTRRGGGGWRCKNLAVPGKAYCEKHRIRNRKKKANEQSSELDSNKRTTEDNLKREGNSNFRKHDKKRVQKRVRVDKQRRAMFDANATSTSNFQKAKYLSKVTELEDDDCVEIFSDEDLEHNTIISMEDCDIDPNIVKYITQKANEVRLAVKESIQSKANSLHEELARKIQIYQSNTNNDYTPGPKKIATRAEFPFFKRCLEQWKHTYISNLLQSYTKKSSLSIEICKPKMFILNGEDLLSLHPTGWLSLAVIMAYAMLIADIAHNVLIVDPFFHSSLHGFDSSFMATLDGFVMEGNLTHKKILIPVNLCDFHWGLIVVDMCMFTITVLDPKLSIDEVNERYHDLVKAIGEHLFKTCRRINEADGDREWTMMHSPQDLPKQLNEYDCGLFILAYMECIARGVPIMFDEDISSSRMVICSDLLDYIFKGE